MRLAKARYFVNEILNPTQLYELAKPSTELYPKHLSQLWKSIEKTRITLSPALSKPHSPEPLKDSNKYLETTCDNFIYITNGELRC